MANSKCFLLPGGEGAFATVRVDPKTGLPLPNADVNSFVKILGRCSSLQNVLREVWDGPTDRHAPPASPIRRQVVSTSPNDTAAGTGTRSVTGGPDIKGSDAKYLVDGLMDTTHQWVTSNAEIVRLDAAGGQSERTTCYYAEAG